MSSGARPPSGTISRLVINDSGCAFMLSGVTGTMELRKQHDNYNAVFSGLLMAASYGYTIDVNLKSGTRVVDFITIHPEI